MLLIAGFFDMAMFTILEPLSLLSSSRLSLQTVGLKIFSLSNFASNSLNRIYIWSLRKI